MFSSQSPYGVNFERDQAIAHYDKYLSFALQIGVSFDSSPMLPEVVEALRRGDRYLNSIALRRWDVFHSFYLRRSHGLQTGGWSLSNTVCTAKCAATLSALRFPSGQRYAARDWQPHRGGARIALFPLNPSIHAI